MSKKREQRLRRKARATLRALERTLAEVAPLSLIAVAAIRYVNEMYAPNIREPFSILNRRGELVEEVRTYQKHSAARAARRAA